MCGIIAYVGPREAYDVLKSGLKRLEYRGYDSSGVALLNGNQKFRIYKKIGAPAALEKYCEDSKLDVSGNIGIGHTRWATHGEPTEANAHPHSSKHGTLALVHNGTLEGYAELRQMLIQNGVTFKSQTDTEILAHLIELVMRRDKLSIIEAVRSALSLISGTYAIVVLTQDGELVAACNGSPLVIGKKEISDSKFEYFFASGSEAFLQYTNSVSKLKDGEMAWIDRATGLLAIQTIASAEPKTPAFIKLRHSLEQIEKGNYEHFMLKEIHEQPRVIQDCISGRIRPDEQVHLSAVNYLIDQQRLRSGFQRIILLACGTSYHSALVMKMFESKIGIPVIVETAAEFRYRQPLLERQDLVILISQSGSTADTIEAGKYAKERGALMFGVCNVVGSAIPQLTETGIYTHAGLEIGVASTKAFTAQVVALTLLSIALGVHNNRIKPEEAREYTRELKRMPEIVGSVIEQVLDPVQDFADYLNRKVTPIELPWYYKFLRPHLKKYDQWAVSNVLFLGRGQGYALAKEGALKLKEISYINSEGIPAAEMKHGPIATVESNKPIIFIATEGKQYENVIRNMHEIKARKGVILSIVTEGDTQAVALSDFVIRVPKVNEMFTSLVVAPVLQLIAYYTAVGRGTDVDKPRNLAKSVTVE